MIDFLPYLAGARSLALIGLGKNVGKTTALNAVVAQATKRLGLTSIGRDGELVDAISSHSKPPIRVLPGTVVATVQGSLPEAGRSFEILETTRERTALGPVVIARARRAVDWELSGPATSRGLAAIRDRLFHYGAELVILDGAFDRRSSATPTLTDVSIVITGASLDTDMSRVLADTAHLLELFRLPASLTPHRKIVEQRHVGIVREGQVVRLDLRSALGHEQEVARALRPGDALLLGSTLTPQMVEALPPGDLDIVIRDATSALIDAPMLRRLRARGARLSVLRPIRLPLVVCNPFSPYGWRFDARLFLEEVARVAAPLPCVDLILGEVLQCESVLS